MSNWGFILLLFFLVYLADRFRNWLEIATYKPDPPTREDRMAALKRKWKEEEERKRRYIDIVAVATLYKFERSNKPAEYVWKATDIEEVTHEGEPIAYKIYKSSHKDGLWYRYTPVEKNVRVRLRVSFHWLNEGEPTYAAPIIFYRHTETGVIQRWQPLGRGEYVTPLGAWTHVEHTRVERLGQWTL